MKPTTKLIRQYGEQKTAAEPYFENLMLQQGWAPEKAAGADFSTLTRYWRSLSTGRLVAHKQAFDLWYIVAVLPVHGLPNE